MKNDAPSPGSAEEYFSILLPHARAAAARNDFGVAAGLSLVAPEKELLVIGENTGYSAADLFGHAEAKAIKELDAFLGARKSGSQLTLLSEWPLPGSSPSLMDLYLFRTLPMTDRPELATMFVTLEPCAPCMAIIVNSGVDRLVIAIPDPEGGCLDPHRLSELAQTWQRKIATLDIVFTQSGNPNDLSTYVPQALFDELGSTYSGSRDVARVRTWDPRALCRGAIDTVRGLRGPLTRIVDGHIEL